MNAAQIALACSGDYVFDRNPDRLRDLEKLLNWRASTCSHRPSRSRSTCPGPTW